MRWHVELGNVAIPMSSSRQHIQENFDVFGFRLSATEIAIICNLGDRPEDGE